MKYLYLLSFLSFFMLNCQSGIGHGHSIDSPTLFQVLQQNDSVQLIDVRTPKEFKGAYIKGAKNFNFFDEAFIDSIKTLNRNKPIYLYCRSGNRSMKSIEKIKALGFTELYSLNGGIIDWEKKGYEVLH